MCDVTFSGDSTESNNLRLDQGQVLWKRLTCERTEEKELNNSLDPFCFHGPSHVSYPCSVPHSHARRIILVHARLVF